MTDTSDGSLRTRLPSLTRSVTLPTRVRDWRLIARTVRLVCTIPGYAVLAAALSVAALSAFVFSQNLELVRFALTADFLSAGDRLTILTELYPFVGTSFGPLTGGALLVVSLLTGVNLAVVVYHLRNHGLSVQEGGGSAVGVLLGTLGAGCAACGAALLVGVLSLFGATGLLTLLPYEGLEFSALAVVALVLSLHWLAQGLRGGEVNGCPLDY